MTEETRLQVRFWGVRGSYPTPGLATVQFGGNTPCVEVQAGAQTIILDAGTGIIGLGRDLLRRSGGSTPLRLTLLFSHMHHDHTQGFPFFAPAFLPGTHMDIFGPQTLEGSLDQVLAQNMIPPVFPVTLNDMSATKTIRSLSEHQRLLLEPGLAPQVILPGEMAPASSQAVLVQVLRSYGHPGGVLIYRLEWMGQSLVYATDTEGYANTDRRLVDFARQADLLIHDAQYTEAHYLGQGPGQRATQGWGHSTPAMACNVAQEAGVRRLALFHFDPTYDDAQVQCIEDQARSQFAGAFAAREGQCILLAVAEGAPRLPVDELSYV